MKTRLALILLVLAAFPAPAFAAASWSAGDTGGCQEIHTGSSPWRLEPGRECLAIYRGWPVRWTIFRYRGQLDVRCWGGKHTQKRPYDLSSVLTMRDVRTGGEIAVNCQGPQGLNWLQALPVLPADWGATIEVRKTPTVRVG